MRGRSTPASVLGELLLTAGALVLLFLVWQLVWTDVIAGAVSAARTEAVEARFAGASSAEGGPAGAASAADPDASAAAPLTGAPATDLSVTAPPAAGGSLAVVHVPRFGPGWSVAALEGIDRADVLDQGVLGHYPGTGLPGTPGNLALAGHRTTYGAPLSRIDELVDGDPIVVETLQGWSSYRVSAQEIVTPDRVDVIAPVPGAPEAVPTSGVLTLTACHPRYSARLRYVVHADLVSTTPRGAGPPAALAEAPTGASSAAPAPSSTLPLIHARG